MHYFAFQRHSRSRAGRTCRCFSSLGAAVGALLFLLGASQSSAPAADDAAGKPTTRPAFPPEAVEFFESRVRPILVDKCFKCHGEKKQSNGLRLDSREAALKGGDAGPALVAGKPDESLLVQAVAQTHAELKMPPSGKLADAAVAALRQWVSQGAPWPAIKTRAVNAGKGRTRSGHTLGVPSHQAGHAAIGQGSCRCSVARGRIRDRQARGGGA